MCRNGRAASPNWSTVSLRPAISIFEVLTKLEGAEPSIDGERSGGPDEEISPTNKAMLEWYIRMRARDTEDGSDE